MKRTRWKAHLNVPTAITPGHIIKVDDSVATPVAIVMKGTGSKGPKEQEDNARLIAAAPELLEALQALRADIGSSGPATNAVSNTTFDLVNSAIRNALPKERK